MSDIRNIKQRFSFTVANLELMLDILHPIVSDKPMRDDHNDIVRLNLMIIDMIDKVYSGGKRPERIPVAYADRQRARPFSTDGLGFSDKELASGKTADIMDRKLEVVGYESYEDSMKAGGFNNNDEVMASILGLTVQEYLDKTAQEAAIEQYNGNEDNKE